MLTSYYAIHGSHVDAVAISAVVPSFYKGRRCTKLSPNYSIFSEWKSTKDNDRFTYRFGEEVLSGLDPNEVYSELGDNAILLCYEKPNDFCHRHLVASWLMRNIPHLIIQEATSTTRSGFQFY